MSIQTCYFCKGKYDSDNRGAVYVKRIDGTTATIKTVARGEARNIVALCDTCKKALVYGVLYSSPNYILPEVIDPDFYEKETEHGKS